MPWTCCGTALHDNQACLSCGARKRSHAMRHDRTRVLSLGDPPFDGDAEAQAAALQRAHDEGSPLVERCAPTTFVELQVLDAGEAPLPGARVLVRLPGGEAEVEAWTDARGLVRVRGLRAEDAPRVRFVVPDLTTRHARTEAAGAQPGAQAEGEA